MKEIYKSLGIGAKYVVVGASLVFGFANFSAAVNQINEVHNNRKTMEEAESIWEGRNLEIINHLTYPGISLANYVIKEFELSQK